MLPAPVRLVGTCERAPACGPAVARAAAVAGGRGRPPARELAVLLAMAAGAARAAVTAAAAAVRGRLAVRGAAVLLAAAMALPLGAQSAAGAADPATAAETSTAEQAPPGATAAAEPAAPAAGSAAEPAPPAEPATGDSPPAADAPATDPPTAEALIRDTLADDVDSASYYELVSELRRLGLDDSGGRRELQARLRAYHELPERAPAPPDAGRPIEIRAAHSAEQFTVEEIDETYVRLRGGVEVAVRDDERDAVHTIRAEELIFNQATRFLTARGGVEYTVTTPDGTDTVRADSLTLDSENFEAVFVDGRVQREHDSGAGPVLFTFSGDTFRHLADDTIILDGARVTSSPDPDTPNYEIRAERMWLLAPGEWAIRNATLYVGRIPVLWVPFYFRPGDRLVFHPAVGIRDREGLFVNTTLYLRGRRPEEDSPFSLLRAQADRYREERHGLFLRPVRPVPEEDATDRMGGATPGAGADQSFLKLMLDAYARLGVHAGVAGSYPELQVGEGEAHVAFRAGVARSRSVWYDSSRGIYTAYASAGNSLWHDTSLFGIPHFPLRYALQLDADLVLPYATLRAGFELFSDPDFDLDFGNRQERFNWPALVGFDSGDDEGLPLERSTLIWRLNASSNLSPLLRDGAAGPRLVEQLRLSNAEVRWLWRRQEQAVGSSPAEQHDPTRTFYYPSTLRLPVAAQVGGTLASFTVAGGARESPAIEPPQAGGRDLRPLSSAESPASAAPRVADTDDAAGQPAAPALRPLEPYTPPAPTLPRSGAPGADPLTLKLTYDLRPRVTIEGYFNDLHTAEEVDLSLRSVTARATHTTTVKHDFDLYGGVLGLDNTVRHRVTAQRLVKSHASLTDKERVDLDFESRRRDGTTVSLENRLTLRPLLGHSPWAGSNVTYDLDLRLINVDYSPYPAAPRTDWPRWDADGVTRHKLAATAAWQLQNGTQRLTLSGVLPPHPADVTTRLQLAGERASASAETHFRCEKGERTLRDCPDWEPQPLNLTVQATPFEPLSLSQQLNVDLQESQVQQSVSTLNLGGLNASLTASHMQLLSSDGKSRTGPKQLRLQQLRLSYGENTDPSYLWRNRINLELDLDAGWTVKFQDYLNSRFTFETDLTLGIHEFLDLSFSTASSNDRTYCYIPAWAKLESCEIRNPIQDLWWSFAFWDDSKRQQSNFKLERISLNAVHHLQDWDLTFKLSGVPATQDLERERLFDWEFSIFVQWFPVPEIRSSIRGDHKSFSIRE